MKQCRPGWKQWITLIFVFLFSALMFIFGVYEVFFDTQPVKEEHYIMILGMLLFGGILIYLFRRILCLGMPWIAYNGQKIVFHFSEKQERAYSWELFMREEISIDPTPMGYIFVFSDKKQFSINQTMNGYKELICMLKTKALLPENM